MKALLSISSAVVFLLAFAFAQPPKIELKGEYVRKGNRSESIRATLKSYGLPNLEGKWFYAGPFDNLDRVGFDKVYAPEKKIDLKETFIGKGGQTFGWKEYTAFKLGQNLDLASLFPNDRDNSVVYLYLEFESRLEFKFPLSLGSDDTCSVYFNGKRILHEDQERPATADQFRPELAVRAGKNQLLIKICQYGGQWEVYVAPDLPSVVPEATRKRIAQDFPASAPAETQGGSNSNEANYYALTTIPLPSDCVLEVGGLAFRPDGKLLACTRRGEIWLIHNPTAEDPQQVRFTRFASGLHEALGIYAVDNNTVIVAQRPELTRLVDRDGDGIADEFTTICDKWGVSGDYHEFAFGPARDKEGNFYITLNVGFGGGHQSKSPWRGWCMKISADGKMEPFAYGLRSPNGINFSPEGDLFYCDNQGEWVATNKMHHLTRGKFYGHQAGLRWVKDSPFASFASDKVASGMLYDGQKGSGAKGVSGMPQLDPPCIWFPYGRMGQSVSEPIWDTTGGKFGPFTGQCFVGDQTKSCVMRVALEKVNGVFQGACFPFRSGLQCGVNRLAFAPDGSLFAGQTNRGWGSLGGKPHGLQRLIYKGTIPFEIHDLHLTENGFDIRFTKPIDPACLTDKSTISSASYTYIYYSNYGCPETDRRAEKVSIGKLSPDGLVLSVTVTGLHPGRVYELRFDGIRGTDGEKLLHDEAYYTLNELVKR